jgi:polyisoprenoid-binding protein YceI
MVASQDVKAPVSVWQIDASHSSVDFAVKHMVVATTRGTFRELAGTIKLDEANPQASSVEATIVTASIDTRDERRDGHLRSPDFFETEKFPTIEFRSRRVEPAGGDRYRLAGDLTIRGVTRSVDLELTYDGQASDPWGGVRAGFEARTSISRADFGLTWNQALETGGMLVGDEVKIQLHVEAVRQ